MKKLCSSCEKPGKFHKNSATKDGLSYKCADCMAKYNAEHYRENRTRILERGKVWAKKNAPRVAFALYKRAANSRGLAFELSMDQFMEFWGKPCFYTGRPIDGIGLDRVDNAKGYVIGNVVPCCLAANKAKMTMSHDEFVALCEEVVKLHGENEHRNKPTSIQESVLFRDAHASA